MPRQSRGRSSSPAAQPRSHAPSTAPAQSRGAHTATAPTGSVPSHAPAPPSASASVPANSATQSKDPGMIAQMAATAGSVAMGSVIGNSLSSMFFGGGSTPAEAQAPAQQQTYQRTDGISCDVQAKDFTKCLESGGDINSCNWYLEQLKACQAAAAPY